MLRVWKPIVNVEAGRIRDRKIDGVIQRLVGWTPGSRERKWEALHLRATVSTRPERLIKHCGAWRDPIQTEGSIAHFVEKVQVLDRGIVNAVCGADAGLARPAENLARQSVRESGRISQSQAGREVVVSRRGERARDARIAGNNPALGRRRKWCGLQTGHDGFDFALRVIPGHAHFPAQTQVQCDIRPTLVRILNLGPTVPRAGVQELLAALVVTGWRPNQKVCNI